jgi:hypothetical protein
MLTRRRGAVFHMQPQQERPPMTDDTKNGPRDDTEMTDDQLESVAGGAAYAKYEGIDGEVKDSGHDGWIDVLSVDWGTHKPGGGTR